MSDDPPGDGRDKAPVERDDRDWHDILQELRVALTGTQRISAFLLAVVAAFVFESVAGAVAGLVAAIVAAVVACGMWGLGIAARVRVRGL